MRDDLRAYVVEHLGDPTGILVVDETGFLKKGDKSAGVQPQYSGAAGRTANCQIGVFLTYAGPRGHTFLDRALYLPKSWTDDRERCRAAGIPDEVVFATKPAQAQAMLERALAAGGPGGVGHRRQRLRRREVPARLAGGAPHRLRPGGPEDTARSSAGRGSGASARTWPDPRPRLGAPERRGRGQGAALVRLGPPPAAAPRSRTAGRRWVLLRRSVADPAEVAAYVSSRPRHHLADLVRVAGTRWTVENCFEAAKQEVGLDEYEVRSWTGWHRHITLACLAHAFLTAMTAQAAEKGDATCVDARGHRAHCGGSAATPGSSRTPTTPRPHTHVELVTLAPTTPSSGPPLPLPPSWALLRGAGGQKPSVTNPCPIHSHRSTFPQVKPRVQLEYEYSSRTSPLPLVSGLGVGSVAGWGVRGGLGGPSRERVTTPHVMTADRAVGRRDQ